MFLTSPALKEFLKERRWTSLSSVNQSFRNYDRFTAIIAKQRALTYPAGRDFNGVVFEFENNAHSKVKYFLSSSELVINYF